jgi:hypothetical protein
VLTPNRLKKFGYIFNLPVEELVKMRKQKFNGKADLKNRLRD